MEMYIILNWQEFIQPCLFPVFGTSLYLRKYGMQGQYLDRVPDCHGSLCRYSWSPEHDLFMAKCSVLYYHMHNNYSEAVTGNEILNSQTHSNNAQTTYVKKSTQVKWEHKTENIKLCKSLKYKNILYYIL